MSQNNPYSAYVYQFLREIPAGKVTTYKQIAESLGNPKLARVVGNILHHNPDGNLNPCYKVVQPKHRKQPPSTTKYHSTNPPAKAPLDNPATITRQNFSTFIILVL